MGHLAGGRGVALTPLLCTVLYRSDKHDLWDASDDTVRLVDMEGRLMSSMKVLPNRRRERSPISSPSSSRKKRSKDT